jgi:hypothetical protein
MGLAQDKMSSEQTGLPEAKKPPRRLAEEWRRHPRTFIAGSLTLAAGILTLLNGIRALANQATFLWLDIDLPINRYSLCGMLIVVFGAVAVAGGVSALLRKHLSLTLPAAALGMVGDGLAGFYMGLAAIILFFLSDEDI